MSKRRSSRRCWRKVGETRIYRHLLTLGVTRRSTVHASPKLKRITTLSLHRSTQSICSRQRNNPYDPRTGLNEFDHERLIREAMILAVQIFNSASLCFKTEVYSVLMNIAWTYLLHQFYDGKKVAIIDEDGRALLLGQMLKRQDCPLVARHER